MRLRFPGLYPKISLRVWVPKHQVINGRGSTALDTCPFGKRSGRVGIDGIVRRNLPSVTRCRSFPLATTLPESLVRITSPCLSAPFCRLAACHVAKFLYSKPNGTVESSSTWKTIGSCGLERTSPTAGVRDGMERRPPLACRILYRLLARPVDPLTATLRPFLLRPQIRIVGSVNASSTARSARTRGAASRVWLVR